MSKTVLVVDPNPRTHERLARLLMIDVRVEFCTDFETARAHLLTQPPDLLVANLRLGAHNGLQLVYQAMTLALSTHALVYDDHDDAGLWREAHRAGAFFVSRAQLEIVLPAYVSADLPSRDRREAGRTDRRHSFRGGRRIADRPAPRVGI